MLIANGVLFPFMCSVRASDRARVFVDVEDKMLWGAKHALEGKKHFLRNGTALFARIA